MLIDGNVALGVEMIICCKHCGQQSGDFFLITLPLIKCHIFAGESTLAFRGATVVMVVALERHVTQNDAHILGRDQIIVVKVVPAAKLTFYDRN